MPLTTAYANSLGDHAIGKTDIGALGDLWLGLFLTDPTISGSQSGEVTGTGYARINITAKMGAFSGGVSTSTAEINFGSPGSDWGVIPYVGFLSAVSAGTMRFFEELANPRSALNGARAVRFTAGEVLITFV